MTEIISVLILAVVILGFEIVSHRHEKKMQDSVHQLKRSSEIYIVHVANKRLKLHK